MASFRWIFVHLHVKVFMLAYFFIGRHENRTFLNMLPYFHKYIVIIIIRERSGAVVERGTPNRKVLVSIPTGVIVLCP